LTFFNDLRNYFISQEKSGHVGLLQKRTYGIGSPTSQCHSCATYANRSKADAKSTSNE